MGSDILKKRELAFEAEFFARNDRRLIEKMHQRRKLERERAALSQVAGIDDENLIQELLDLGLEPHNLEILSLVPLVAVAWASGEVERDQRRLTLEAAGDDGLCSESGSLELLERWLEAPMDARLLHAWKEYAGVILKGLEPDARENLKRHWLERAERVARASTGRLGLHTVSKKERAALDELDQSLTV